MPSAVQMIIPSLLLILAWVIIWLTTVPLLHIHLPDTTGGPASLQGGLAHTVFSPDLPGEFSHSFNVAHQEHFFHVSNRVSNSPELGIALLDDNDAKKRKVRQASVLGVQPISPQLLGGEWGNDQTRFYPVSRFESHPNEKSRHEYADALLKTIVARHLIVDLPSQIVSN
jgi:hypothetical protein